MAFKHLSFFVLLAAASMSVNAATLASRGNEPQVCPWGSLLDEYVRPHLSLVFTRHRGDESPELQVQTDWGQLGLRRLHMGLWCDLEGWLVSSNSDFSVFFLRLLTLSFADLVQAYAFELVFIQEEAQLPETQWYLERQAS